MTAKLTIVILALIAVQVACILYSLFKQDYVTAALAITPFLVSVYVVYILLKGDSFRLF